MANYPETSILNAEWDETEHEAITACALRFDGYKFFSDRNLFVDEALNTEGAGSFVVSSIPSFDAFLDEPDYGLPVNTLHAMLFFLQRSFMRERWLRANSYGAKIARQLFLRLAPEKIDGKYAADFSWLERWDVDFAPRLKDYIALVERNLKNTSYTSKEAWVRERV